MSKIVNSAKTPLSVCVIGGGLAGLTTAILLSKNGFQVTVIEKKQIPFHRVCGEYISNEALPFLSSLGLDLKKEKSSSISRLTVSSATGHTLNRNLGLGGFGLSRNIFDDLLYQKAKAGGVDFIFDKATDISYADDHFTIHLSSGEVLKCAIAIASYGKRSNLDQKLNRSFFHRRSPYLGVKYHVKTDMASDLIRLDIFKGGYCGTCKIQDDLFNLCYLSEAKNMKNYSGIPEMEKEILYQNKNIKYLFENSDFVLDKPEVINEISFEKKSLVEDHILFCGDSAGMITPLCGNGMAIAIHSGKILAECIVENGQNFKSSFRATLEKRYQERWEKEFAFRLKAGRFIQRLFLNPQLSNIGISILKRSTFLSKLMINNTHGKSF